MARISTKGFKELDKKLQELEDAYASRQLRSVALAGANIIRDEAASNVRRLFKVKTGALLRSLLAKESKNPNFARAYVAARGTIANHAHLLEYGHRISPRGKAGGKKNKLKRVKASERASTGHKIWLPPGGKGFFRMALDSKRKDVRNMLKEKMRSILMDRLRGGASNSFTPDDTGWIG